MLQRGRFCLNTAFRDIIYIKDFTIFRAYVLAVVIAMVAANLLELLGLLHTAGGVQEFAYVANIIGGYLFGVGMVLAGGCGSGTLYRVGEGMVGSWMAMLGFMIGSAATQGGALSGMYTYLRGFVAPTGNATLYGILGVNKWLFILLACAAGIAFAVKGRTRFLQSPGYHWRVSGPLIGVIATLGLFMSEIMTGSAKGISFPDPSGRLLMSVTAGSGMDWGVYVLIGTAAGSFISARSGHEFSWRAPRADVMAQQLAGGLIMGAGGALAGGCVIGHGLSGLAVLSSAGLVSLVFMILGSWTMVYLLFMRRGSKS